MSSIRQGRADGFPTPKLLALLLALVSWAAVGCGQPEPTAETSLLDAADDSAAAEWQRLPEVSEERTRRIFDRLLAVYPSLSNPKLRIADHDPDPWAWATPEGIALSQGALRLCYEGVDPDQGDALLAFVISHELAHLAGDHFFHLRVREAIGKTSGSSRRKLELASRLQDQDQRKEIEADEKGLIHLALAGFDPWLLLAHGSELFFERWARQHTAALAFSHLDPPGRAALLEGTVRRVADNLDYFRWGVRFYQVGRYEEARALFESFESHFPGPAVLNNLGLCHYQLAAQRLASCDGQLVVRFKLPTLLATDTIAQRFVGRGAGGACYEDERFKRHKRAAESYFIRTLERHEDYLPARINYLSLMLLSQNDSGILSRTFEISKTHPQYADLELLQVVGLYLRVHGTAFFSEPTAYIQRLRELRRARPDSADLAYDLARILLESNQADAAEQEWRRFLELEPHGPYADYVRRQYGIPPAQSAKPAPGPAPPRPLGRISSETRSWLDGVSDPLLLRADDMALQQHRNGEVRALVRDGSLVAVELTLKSPLSTAQIRERYGNPLYRIPTTSGEFVAYEGFGFDLVEGRAPRRVHF